MDAFLHSLHHWQHAALAWLSARDPLTVDAAMLLAMTLEGMGIPGIPGEVPMLAQAALIHSPETARVAVGARGGAAAGRGVLVLAKPQPPGRATGAERLGWAA